MEIEQPSQLLDFLLHRLEFVGFSLSVGFFVFALGHDLLGALLVELALGLLFAEAGDAGGIDPFSSEQLTEFAGFLAGISEFENAHSFCGRKSSPCRFLDHLGIGDRAPALERCGRGGRLVGSVAVLGDAFGNQSVHGMSLLHPDDLQYFAYGIFSQAIVAHGVMANSTAQMPSLPPC